MSDVKINRKQFTTLMIEYGFARLPRAVGNPNQALIYDFSQFLHFFKINNGSRPVFASTNSYYTIDVYGNPTEVFLERIFLDLDTDTGYTLEESHKECIKVAEYCQEDEIPLLISFSGNGFHCHMMLKPKARSLDMWLSQAIKAIQYRIKEELNLKTLNTQCAEPKRLVRVPFSQYVSKAPGSREWLINPNYCIPLTLHQLITMKTDDIVKLSHRPVLESSYLLPGRKTGLKRLLKNYEIDARTFKDIPMNGIKTEVDYTTLEGQDMFEIVKMLIPLPCLHRALWAKNPPHVIRFSACAFLTSVLTREEALTFFDKLSHEAEWNDRANKSYRTYQVDNIYMHTYRPHDCEELIRLGYCAGEECWKYKDKIAEIELTNEKRQLELENEDEEEET